MSQQFHIILEIIVQYILKKTKDIDLENKLFLEFVTNIPVLGSQV